MPNLHLCRDFIVFVSRVIATPPQEDRATAIGNMQEKLVKFGRVDKIRAYKCRQASARIVTYMGLMWHCHVYVYSVAAAE